ncbi:MAG TPA: VCBS repeat-containing protein, partial [Thermoanaerobaculia bacterium]
MKRLVLTLVLCLPVFAAPAIIRNAPAIAFDDDVHIVRTGDFNGDSHLDFAVRGLDGVHIVLGNGDGTFDAPIEIAIADGPTLEFADLDADNDLDFVLTVGNAATSTFTPTHVYLNNGAAVFTAGTTIYSKSDVLRLADVTGDSKPDLITCGAYYPGLGDGTFGPVHQHENCFIDSTYVFDADADGDLDILTANFSTLIGATWPSKLWRNDGAGTFASAEVPVKSRAVAIADYDDNDLPDIAWLDKTGHRVVLFANAGGTYTEQTSDSGYAKVRDLTATDLNGDSRPDLIAAGDGLAHVWLTEPGGAMSAHTIFATGNETSAIATGDFDADGNIDMLAVGRAGTITGTTTQSLVSLL